MLLHGAFSLNVVALQNRTTSISNGSVFRIARYEPGVAGRWTSTETIDYAVVLSGEMWMQLEAEEVHLRTGDVVIQRGTSHNWANHGSQPCVMMYVLIAWESTVATRHALRNAAMSFVYLPRAGHNAYQDEPGRYLEVVTA